MLYEHEPFTSLKYQVPEVCRFSLAFLLYTCLTEGFIVFPKFSSSGIKNVMSLILWSSVRFDGRRQLKFPLRKADHAPFKDAKGMMFAPIVFHYGDLSSLYVPENLHKRVFFRSIVACEYLNSC